MVAASKLTIVGSQAFMAYGYDTADQTLTIQFNNGKTIDYEHFPEVKWEEFKSAESKGRWYNQNVRGNKNYQASQR